jgi:hypothetical protein
MRKEDSSQVVDEHDVKFGVYPYKTVSEAASLRVAERATAPKLHIK